MPPLQTTNRPTENHRQQLRSVQRDNAAERTVQAVNAIITAFEDFRDCIRVGECAAALAERRRGERRDTAHDRRR